MDNNNLKRLPVEVWFKIIIYVLPFTSEHQTEWLLGDKEDQSNSLVFMLMNADNDPVELKGVDAEKEKHKLRLLHTSLIQAPLALALVCRAWHQLSIDNLIWRPIYLLKFKQQNPKVKFKSWYKALKTRYQTKIPTFRLVLGLSKH